MSVLTDLATGVIGVIGGYWNYMYYFGQFNNDETRQNKIMLSVESITVHGLKLYLGI